VASALLFRDGMKIRAYLQERSPGSVVAWCPDLPGCSATGRSPDQTLGVLAARIEEYFGAGRREATPRGARKVEFVYGRQGT
jgi:predicted RNase H-like HicB family nuclease